MGMIEAIIIASALAGAAGVWWWKKRAELKHSAAPEQKTPAGLGPQNPFSRLKKIPVSAASQKLDELEEVLLTSDMGAAMAQHLLEKAAANPEKLSDGAGQAVKTEMKALLSLDHKTIEELCQAHRPLVISVVGINGAGKTTTIGKLAHQLSQSGKKVLLGAADTFRAGAIGQLKTWAERSGAEFVTGREGADPGAVAFDAITAAKAREVDVVLIDTAGRLHTKSNLMDELKKIHKVIKKVDPIAPHETWLVVDGTLGQNSLNQAREFQDCLGLTGLVLTKMDGTAKGGAILPITKELSLPVVFMGIGEGLDDLVPFDAEKFVDAIF